MKTELGLTFPGSKTGILLLHDVGGAAAELRPQAQALARAGFTVSCPQLIGLGEDAGAGQGSAGMLVSEAEQALSRLKGKCDSVVAVGIGYGAMLALELARHNGGSVQAVVLIEPQAWLPAPAFRFPAALSGRVKQSWIAAAIGAARRVAGLGREASPASGLLHPGRHDVVSSTAALLGIGKLLDSVHAGLPAVKQPVLLIHGQSSPRIGRDGAFLLQRRLGGRVESVMLDRADRVTGHDDQGLDFVVERTERFVAAVTEEIETRRGNEARRQKVAAGRTTAA
jgi:carboxylesterase